MSIGDVTSNARGTGARFNDGKVAYELLPLRVVLDIIRWEPGDIHLKHMLAHLADWQAGDDAALTSAIDAIMPWPCPWIDTFADAARVFDYGRKKYAAWNWAKGMPWSVPFGCTIRHALKELDGQELDDESGLPHRGHIHCNLLMLKLYAQTYPEGDDRPKGLFDLPAAKALDSVSMDAPPNCRPPFEGNADALPRNLARAVSGIGDVPYVRYRATSTATSQHPMAAEADRIAEDRL